MSEYNPIQVDVERFSRPIDFFARRIHYIDHMAPIWPHLENRGKFYVPIDLVEHTMKRGIDSRDIIGLPYSNSGKIEGIKAPPGNPLFVCAYMDLEAGWLADYRRPFIMMEHGVGLTFGSHPAYAGGIGLRQRVHLFLAPNEFIRNKTAKTYPEAPQIVIGTPKLDYVKPMRPNTRNPTIVISFHWDGRQVAREAGNAFDHYRDILPSIAKQFHLVGHAHPRIQKQLKPLYNELGITEFIVDFEEVMQVGDLYINDASSTAYEFATTMKPVILLNSPVYRRNIDYGIRFWRWTDFALSVDHPDQLLGAIQSTLDNPLQNHTKQKTTVSDLYPYLGTSANRAANAIGEFLRGRYAVQNSRCSNERVSPNPYR